MSEATSEQLICSECEQPITDATYFWGRDGGQWHQHCMRKLSRNGCYARGMDHDNPHFVPRPNVHLAICRDCVWRADIIGWHSINPAVRPDADKIGDRCDCPNNQRQSPVSGEWYQPNCEDVNDGNCPHFEPKKTET